MTDLKKEKYEEICRKISGCNRFKTCSWEIFCQGIEQALSTQKQEFEKMMNEIEKDYELGLEMGRRIGIRQGKLIQRQNDIKEEIKFLSQVLSQRMINQRIKELKDKLKQRKELK